MRETLCLTVYWARCSKRGLTVSFGRTAGLAEFEKSSKLFPKIVTCVNCTILTIRESNRWRCLCAHRQCCGPLHSCVCAALHRYSRGVSSNTFSAALARSARDPTPARVWIVNAQNAHVNRSFARSLAAVYRTAVGMANALDVLCKWSAVLLLFAPCMCTGLMETRSRCVCACVFESLSRV